MSTTDHTVRARSTDPVTSHEAAADAQKRRETTRAHVLAVLREVGEDFTLADAVVWHGRAVREGRVPPASESGVRSRIAEMVRDGAVVLTGATVARGGGRRMRLHRVV